MKKATRLGGFFVAVFPGEAACAATGWEHQAARAARSLSLVATNSWGRW